MKTLRDALAPRLARAAARPRWLALVCALAAAWTVAACQEDEVEPLPNRVLDRPLDLVMGCFRVVGGQVEALAYSQCNAEVSPACGAVDSDGASEPQVLGFVTNSERNELALVRRCDYDAGVVDLDRQAPGYNLLPVGRLPSALAGTANACQVITANAGSCDLSRINAIELAAYGLGGADTAEIPSSLVATIVPKGAGGRPLASRPAKILAVPPRISSAAGSGESFEMAPVGCEDPSGPSSVYLSFPGCQLIAEIDLNSQRVLQSRRFVPDGAGGFDIVDAGTDPVCPVDCPLQFGDEAIPPEVGDAQGFRPSALTLAQADDTDPRFVDYDALFVGGLGGDQVFEIRIDETGRWVDPSSTAELTLEVPRGVLGVKPTPIVYMGDGTVPHQFLYVVAGDGSTRVIDRSADPGAIGVECDTQVDPSLDSSRDPCTPVVPGASVATVRRPGVLGPGLRAPGGAAITDWTFFAYPGSSEANADPPNSGGAPFDTADPQVVAIGVTTAGQVLYATLDQYQSASVHNPRDPQGVMNLSIAPHSIWPSVDPTEADVAPTVLPRVQDREPSRAQPGGPFSMQGLAPTVRRVDAAYAAGERPSQEDLLAAAALGNPTNVDALAQTPDALYENEVARVVARDYQRWSSDDWALVWEGSIPGTRSATGRISCPNPVTTPGDDPQGVSWEGALCAPGSNDPADPNAGPTLIDEGAAFCDRGVLPGDKVVLLGCQDDSDCGIGQRCLQEPTAPLSTTGICVSEQAFDADFERLRVMCAPFINDPCGSSRREFLVTRAFQDQLYLQAMDIDEHSVMRPAEAAPNALEEIAGHYTCLAQRAEPAATCYIDSDCAGGEGQICGADGVCRSCLEGEPACAHCELDADCVGDFGDGATCLDNQCWRPCASGDPECTRAPLPGPLCFAELVDYVVRARDSFVVERSGGGFFADRVTTRGALSGGAVAPELAEECVVDESVSPYLTSRIRLGADEYSTFDDPANPFRIPACSAHDAVPLLDANPCRVTVSRDPVAPTLFHAFDYFPQGAPPIQIPAIRFSNPALSLTLDLVSLADLVRAPVAFPGQPWPTSAPEFRRARIPENYSETFTSLAGYSPIALSIAVGDTQLVYPVRIVPGAESYSAYIVDAGGTGGTGGVRGQVIRVEVDGYVTGAITDQNFRVR